MEESDGGELPGDREFQEALELLAHMDDEDGEGIVVDHNPWVQEGLDMSAVVGEPERPGPVVDRRRGLVGRRDQGDFFDKVVESSSGGSSGPIFSTQELRERALKLPVDLISLRNSGDVSKIHAWINAHFDPNCVLQTSAINEPVTGRDNFLKLVIAGMEILPDSFVVFERCVLKPSSLVYSCSTRGTRIDSLPGHDEASSGHNLLPGPFNPGTEKITKNWYASKLSEGANRLLSFAELQQIQQMEDKVRRQEALAQVEVQAICMWTFQEGFTGEGLPPIVHADHRYILRDFGLVPLPPK